MRCMAAPPSNRETAPGAALNGVSPTRGDGRSEIALTAALSAENAMIQSIQAATAALRVELGGKTRATPAPGAGIGGPRFAHRAARG